MEIRMSFEHEYIKDDSAMQLHFIAVDSANELIPVHWHRHLELLYMVKGTMTAYVNDMAYELSAGDIFVVRPKELHNTHAHENCRYYLLQVSPYHLEYMTPDWDMLYFEEYIPAHDAAGLNDRISGYLGEMIPLDLEKKEGWRLLFLTQLYNLLYVLLSKASKRISPQRKHRNDRDFLRIQQCMDFVGKNYAQKLSLEDVADLISVTPEYFCRLFKKYTGQTFFTYVSQVRMMQFYKDLTKTEESITYLLEKNGITNYKAFMRDFKKAYGTTPHRLRCKNNTSI